MPQRLVIECDSRPCRFEGDTIYIFPILREGQEPAISIASRELFAYRDFSRNPPTQINCLEAVDHIVIGGRQEVVPREKILEALVTDNSAKFIGS